MLHEVWEVFSVWPRSSSAFQSQNLPVYGNNQILPVATIRSGISQSAQRLFTCWTVRSLIPGENKISLHTRPDRPWGPPSSCTLGNRALSSGSGCRSVALSTHPPPALKLRMSRTTPLLRGHSVVQFVEALRYNPEVGGLDSRWC